MMTLQELPDVSIVMPVYNEELLLRPAILELRQVYSRFSWNYEIIISENGSTDGTVEIARNLVREFAEVVFQSIARPDYGKALRHGIQGARGTFVICEEIDLCDTDFHVRALSLLERGGAEMVVGSKVMSGAVDRRPLVRRLATRAISGLLWIAVGFSGTDTHGLKALRRTALLPIVQECVLNRDLFASELVIRAARTGKRVVEIPVHIEEKRPPSIGLGKRVPKVLADLVRLFYAIRIQKRPSGQVPVEVES